MAFSTTNCCDGYVVTIGVVCTVWARGLSRYQPADPAASAASAASQIHLRRRRRLIGASSRSMRSLERSGGSAIGTAENELPAYPAGMRTFYREGPHRRRQRGGGDACGQLRSARGRTSGFGAIVTAAGTGLPERLRNIAIRNQYAASASNGISAGRAR